MTKTKMVTIDVDDNPRELNENLATFETLDVAYTSPDTMFTYKFDSFEDYLIMLTDIDNQYTLEYYAEKVEDTLTLEKLMNIAEKAGYIIKLVDMYSSSASETIYSLAREKYETRYTTGFIYASKEDIRKWYGVKYVTKSVREKVINDFENEINDWNDYAQGYTFVEEEL